MMNISEQEEEYHFEEPDESGVFTVETEEEPGGNDPADVIRKLLVRKNILIGFGLMVVIIAVYKLLGIFSTPKQVKQVTPVVQAQTEVNTTRLAPVTDQLTRQLASLELAMRNSSNNFSKMTGQLTALNESMRQINAKLSEMGRGIASLGSQVQLQSKQLAKMQEKDNPTQTAAMRRPVIYYIQAMVPGRAWLKSSRGTALTVGVGSTVPGYGTVKEIDPQNGVVVLKTGKRIRYSPEDE